MPRCLTPLLVWLLTGFLAVPMALYPDALVSQLLMTSTYPPEVV
jgi:hypothetical protein